LTTNAPIVSAGWSAADPGAVVAAAVVVVVVVVVVAGVAAVCAKAEPVMPRARIENAEYFRSAVRRPG
jgi:hypothetical protein